MTPKRNNGIQEGIQLGIETDGLSNQDWMLESVGERFGKGTTVNLW
ncbi:MAG: hypothetical protein H8E24_13190 [Verrucomicrobia bacterium]|nr:hypothetical protein [Verrucomicrobiota bacterium]